MPDTMTIDDLRKNLRGQLIQPGDRDYDNARTVYNGMIDKRPRLIAKCADVADVITAVNFGRETNMLMSIFGGGHNAAGLGVCDDGLVINLSNLNYTRVDPVAKTVIVGGGTTWGDVDHATYPFGLAVPAGIISTTGVGGLALGGGIGYLARKYGLTVDNILGVDMVLADGSYVTANEKENPDLYWAVRGGGGNFGVVTSFKFKLNPVKSNYAGPTLWNIEKTDEVLKWYRDFTADLNEDLYGFFAILTVPPGPPFPQHLHNKKMCGVVWSYTGPAEKIDAVFKPIRAFGPPALDGVGPIPYPVMQSMFDALYPPGFQWYWRADFVKNIPDEAASIHKKFALDLPTPASTMHLYPIDGAVHRVGKNDTAFAYRDVRWAQVMVGVDPDKSNREKITNWTKNYYEALHKFSAGGAYVNFMMDEGQDRVKASYQENYDRLAKIKAKYDPKNLFRVNQNIRPA
jgi:UDP-N-acetylenolpyruvoylglucosamine reductase